MSASPTSTAPAYKAALLALLLADTNLTTMAIPGSTTPGVQMTATWQGDATQIAALYYGKVEAKVETPVMAGPRVKRQEVYGVEVHIDVCDGSNDVSCAEVTAHSIMGELDSMVASNAKMDVGGNPLQSGAQVFKSVITGWVERPYRDDTRNGWAVLLTVTIEVTARLG